MPDSFKFTVAGSVAGAINGAGGTDTFDYVLAGVSISLNRQTGAATRTGGFSSIETVLAGSGTDTLTGADAVNTIWNLTGPNAGNIGGAGSFVFSGFESLMGGTSTDSFVIGSGVTFGGTVNGGIGSDTVDADDGANTWMITPPNSSNAGNVTGITGGFSSIENLLGGSAQDVLTFSNGANVDGLIDGKGGTDTVDYSACSTAITVSLVTGPQNIEILRGGSTASDSLTGSDSVATWNLTSSNAGTVGGTTFINFESLVGGSQADTFVLAATISFSGSINGGASNSDEFRADNVPNTWTITSNNTGTVTGITGTFSNIENLTGGSNTDSFRLSNGVSVAGTLNGQGGSDTLDFGLYSSSVTVTLMSSAANGFSGSSTGGSFAGINSVIGGSATTDLLTGRDVANTWTLGSSHSYDDGAGFGTLGFSALETLQGGSAVDTFNIGSGIVGTLNLKGSAGDDVFKFTVNGASLPGTIDGEAGTIDTLDYALFTSGVTVNIQTSAAGVEKVIGGSGNDTLIGGNGKETLIGGAGNDRLEGGDGSDSLDGGSGDDRYVFGVVVNPGPTDEIDTINELDGGGNDTLDFSQLATNVTVDCAKSSGLASHLKRIINGSTKNTIETVLGGAGNDSILGTKFNDRLDGGPGDDMIDGQKGNDVIIGGPEDIDGNDSLIGDKGDDRISGGAGNDTLLGMQNNDSLFGGDGDDSLLGDSGNDELTDGKGVDRLIGDAGDDKIEISECDGSIDVIDGGKHSKRGGDVLQGKKKIPEEESIVANSIESDIRTVC